MNSGRPMPQEPVEPSVELDQGWHCTHLFYRFDRARLAALSPDQIRQGGESFQAALDPGGQAAPARLQSSIVSGHKADFAVLAMDPHPLRIDAVHQQLLAGPLGSALEATYSFVSITEVSEYVPTVEQYAQRLIEEGETEGSPAFDAKVKGYERREPMMRRQRLTPDLPDLARHLLLSHEQETQGERELVHAQLPAAQSPDGRACAERHGLCRQSLAADHRRCGAGRLGVGCHFVGQAPRIPERHCLPHAL